MNNKKKKNMLPALAMAGPVSVWMISGRDMQI